ncbi:hypothetical protein [Haladaptatus sp. R4]|uniref:hypothetical protein n=1 Tax=Haladaptatus sp. R4 TaxID=1679489 RepID=UPI00167FF705|nr:hypothetical protein [Haladaptatus sp. R4]
MVVDFNELENCPDSNENEADENHTHLKEWQRPGDPKEVQPKADELSKGCIDEWTNHD